MGLSRPLAIGWPLLLPRRTVDDAESAVDTHHLGGLLVMFLPNHTQWPGIKLPLDALEFNASALARSKMHEEILQALAAWNDFQSFLEAPGWEC